MAEPLQARIPAGVDTPDKLLFGLTSRQLGILAGAGTTGWLLYTLLRDVVPPVVFAIAAIPLAATAAAVALGRRDGLSLDLWLWHALRGRRGPQRHAPAAQLTDGVATLRLPVAGIAPDGVVTLACGHTAVIVACSTVGFFLRDHPEQHTAVQILARWCNSLTTPVQITITTRPVDLHTPAAAILERAGTLPHPALATAAAGYAAFLRQLATERDPLTRQVLITHRARDPVTARRAADHTARTLAGLGVATMICDGGTVTDLLTACCHPWQTPRYGRATPQATITAGTP